MIGLLLFLLIVLIVSLFVSIKMKCEVEEILPLSFFSTTLIIFVFGLLDNIKLGIWFVVVLAIVFLSIMIQMTTKNKIVLAEIKGKIITPVLCVVFPLTIFCIIYANFGRVPNFIDDFSFWAVSVKKMFYLNVLPCVEKPYAMFSEYPPGLQLLEVFPMFLSGKHEEWMMYVVMDIYVIALFFPFFRKASFKKWYFCIPLFIVALFGASLNFEYWAFSLLVDAHLGVTFAYGMAVILRDKTDLTFTSVKIALCCSMLILIKTAGFFLACILLITFFATRFKELMALKKESVVPISFQLLPFIVWKLWNIKWRHSGLGGAHTDKTYDFKEFVLIILGKFDKGYRVDAFRNFCEYYFRDDDAYFGRIEITPFALALTILGLVICAILLMKNGNRKRFVIATCVSFIGYVAYVVGMLAMYMYDFSEEQAVITAGFGRYINIYHTVFTYTILFLLIDYLLEKNNGAGLSMLVVSLLGVGYFIDIIVPPMLNRQWVADSRAYQETYTKMYDDILDKGVEQFSDKRVLLISNNVAKSRLPIMIMKYKMFPYCEVIDYPVLRTDEYLGTYGAEDLKESIQNDGIDYVAVYHVDDNFIDTFGDCFDEPLEDGNVIEVGK